MKFAAAIVLLAIALAVDGGVVPLPAVWAPQPSLAVSQPVLTSRYLSGWDFAPAGRTVYAHGAATAHAYAAAPISIEGQYVAANRGAVHVAPLLGHSQSAQSVNLEAAPGTW